MKAFMIACLFAMAAIASGQESCTVVIPADATIVEKTAGRELSEHLRQAMASPVSVKTEGEKITGPAIYVGRTSVAKEKGIDFQTFGPEEWLIEAGDHGLILGGGKPRGTVYAVWEFLEREIGVMWLDETTTYIPRIKELKWPADLKLRGQPAFTDRKSVV